MMLHKSLAQMVNIQKVINLCMNKYDQLALLVGDRRGLGGKETKSFL